MPRIKSKCDIRITNYGKEFTYVCELYNYDRPTKQCSFHEEPTDKKCKCAFQRERKSYTFDNVINCICARAQWWVLQNVKSQAETHINNINDTAFITRHDNGEVYGVASKK